MELGEILSDALVYPFHNIKALIIYLILGIILGITGQDWLEFFINEKYDITIGKLMHWRLSDWELSVPLLH